MYHTDDTIQSHPVTMLIYWPTQVEPEEQYKIIVTDVPNCFQVHVRHGFNEHVVTQNLSQLIHERLRKFIIGGDGMLNGPLDQHDEITRQKLDALEKANKEGVVYIIGKEQLKPNPKAGFMRGLALNVFIWLRQLSRSKVAEMDFQLADVFEVGIFTQI
jgi:KUP system potassium uptake protein